MKAVELPPTHKGKDELILWFMEKHEAKSGPTPDWKILYLSEILSNGFQNYTKYTIGTRIHDWVVQTGGGIENYDDNFKPALTPDVMIRLGIFGGLGIQGIEREIPIEWIMYGLIDDTLTYYEFPDQTRNYFKIISDPYPLEDGSDSRKFFHWYCRYHLGNRCSEDSDMIALWNSKYFKYRKVSKHSERNNSMSQQNLVQFGFIPEISKNK